MLEIGNFIEIESRLVIIRSWGERGMRTLYTNRYTVLGEE